VDIPTTLNRSPFSGNRAATGSQKGKGGGGCCYIYVWCGCVWVVRVVYVAVSDASCAHITHFKSVFFLATYLSLAFSQLSPHNHLTTNHCSLHSHMYVKLTYHKTPVPLFNQSPRTFSRCA